MYFLLRWPPQVSPRQLQTPELVMVLGSSPSDNHIRSFRSLPAILAEMAGGDRAFFHRRRRVALCWRSPVVGLLGTDDRLLDPQDPRGAILRGRSWLRLTLLAQVVVESDGDFGLQCTGSGMSLAMPTTRSWGD